jgi:hypothetical protein
MGKKYQRMQGESMEQFQRRCNEAETAAKQALGGRPRGGRRRRARFGKSNANADHVDGYDRDDLGESPDY